MRRLQTRFILAGGLLLMATVGTSLWSALTFARLSEVAGNTLERSQGAIDQASALATALEREDDALLLALTTETERAQRELAQTRQSGDAAYQRLLTALHKDDTEQWTVALSLGRQLKDYRRAGTQLIAESHRPDALEIYYKRVNPLLRQAVSSCGNIREANFRSIQRAGVRARDEAHRATWIVACICIAAIVLATLVSAWLARSVVLPVRALTDSVEAVRQGDFERRLVLSTADELGQLATGFNRMAETLAEYRRSSLGELLAAKITLEATLNTLPDAVFVLAPDATLATVNAPAHALLEAWNVRATHDAHALPLKPEHHAAMELALAGRASVPSRTDFAHTLQVTLGGQLRRFLVTTVPIPEFLPHRTGAALVLTDVTEFVRLDELRSELIGVASHELKTPLTTLHMNLLLLSEKTENLTPRQREMLAAAELGCEELQNTIDELLDVTRIEARQLRLNFAPVDLLDLSAQVRKNLQPRFEDAGVRCELIGQPDNSVVWGDAARLRIVLTNLLTNALKYSPASATVTLTIASGQNTGSDRAGPIIVTVTDSGPGVPPEFRERIFEKFFRVEHHLGHNRNSVPGTGIGLYLCREILKAHGGWIVCEQRDTGAGACFRLGVPRPPS
jgi:two-component system, NtrC family, sensor histidine kinase KinB